MRTSIRAAGAATLAAALLSTGCTSKGTDSGANRGAPVVDLGKVKLVSYNGCDDMLAGLRTATVKNVGPWGVGDPGVMYMEARGEGDMAARGKADAPEHSTTNVHEPGADEPDLVKTDGRRVITVNRGVLRVVDTSTKKVTGTLKLVDPEQAWAPADLLVHGDRALVLFSGGGIIPYGARVKRAVNTGPRYVLVDLSGEPKVIGSLTPAGSHVDARMVGSTVRIVVRSQPELNFPDLGTGLTDTERTRRNVAFVRKAPIGAWLPKFEMTDDKGVTTNGAVRCERVSHPAEYTGTSMLTVHTLDLARGIGGTDPIGVAADGDTVYATPTSLYVTSNPRWWWPRSIEPPMIDDAPKPPKDAPRVEPTPSEPTVTFSPSEPAEPDKPADEPTAVPPSGSPVDPAVTVTPTPAPPLNPTTSSPAPPKPAPAPVAPPEETEIHRFDITAPEAPRYVASGKVAGRLLNQYSLSEYEGHLRIATTTTSGQDSSSAVSILKADTLNPVGEVGGLGTGERIYSVRFIGPVGYVVTFREMDPLYTLDLSTPATPKKTGQLKITGYSAYLHPAGEGRLIGVGQEATKKGRALGTQVSLFDVTNPAGPRRLSQMFQRDSGSEAEWNPHAFLYWPKTGTVVLPLNTWDGTWQTSGSALVLTVTDTAVTTAGTIVHPKPKPRSSKTRPVPFDPSIRRSIVIGDELWTASDLGFKISSLKDLADRAWIPFS